MSQPSQPQTKLQLANVLQQKHQAAKDYEKQLAKLNFLKKSEWKNYQLARLYEIEIKKLEERDQMKQRLLELRREADEVALEQMRLKKERIAQIRQQQQEVAQGKEGNLQEMQRSKASYVKEYKNRMSQSKFETKSSILSENLKIHDQMRAEEKERLAKLKELRSKPQPASQQNYESKVQQQMRVAQELQGKTKELEKEEQRLLNRLKDTQEHLQKSQRDYFKIQSSPVTKRRGRMEGAGSY